MILSKAQLTRVDSFQLNNCLGKTIHILDCTHQPQVQLGNGLNGNYLMI